MRARNGRILSVVSMLVLELPAGEAAAQSTVIAAEVESAVADTVLNLAQAFNAAWQKMEPEQILNFYSDDFQYYWMGLNMPSRAVLESAFHQYILPRTQS